VHEEVLGVRQAQGLDEALDFCDAKSRVARKRARLSPLFFSKTNFFREPRVKGHVLLSSKIFLNRPQFLNDEEGLEMKTAVRAIRRLGRCGATVYEPPPKPKREGLSVSFGFRGRLTPYREARLKRIAVGFMTRTRGKWASVTRQSSGWERRRNWHFIHLESMAPNIDDLLKILRECGFRPRISKKVLGPNQKRARELLELIERRRRQRKATTN